MKKEYRKEYAKKMYLFFTTYDDAKSAPSFEKFARSIGVTLEALERYRSHGEFDRSYRECVQIRKDYLLDRALTKQFDPSFVKYLLSDAEAVRDKEDDALSLTLEVIGS